MRNTYRAIKMETKSIAARKIARTILLNLSDTEVEGCIELGKEILYMYKY